MAAISRRQTAGSVFLRAAEAVRPGRAVRGAVREILVESAHETWKNVIVVEAGKAAKTMVEELADAMADALVTDPTGTNVADVRPLPIDMPPGGRADG